MTAAQLLGEGFTLLVSGMGFVFVFLTLLVYATGFMSKLVMKYAKPDPVPSAAPQAKLTAAPTQDNQLMAVISAAIHRHRNKDK